MTTTSPPPQAVATGRLPGPDVVRAVALIGVVVMNYHGYLLLRDPSSRGTDAVDRFFDPWSGPLATRFAATFVLVAGVGVTLLTRRSIGDPVAVRRRRWTLVRRGVVLYLGGLLLDEIWPGTILPYYGLMFVLAAGLFTLRTRWVVGVGVAAAVAGAAIARYRVERAIDGVRTTWFTSPGGWSPRGLLLDVTVNGTHPLLPWLAFLCAGIVVGRALRRPGWRPPAIGLGLCSFAIATVIGSAASGPRAALTASTPGTRSLVYTASALGTALVAFGVVSWVADRWPDHGAIRWLGAAGTMSLSLYVVHVLVFDLLVVRLGWIRPTGLDTALLFAATYWVVALAVAVWWRRHLGAGPFERLYRWLGG